MALSITSVDLRVTSRGMIGTKRSVEGEGAGPFRPFIVIGTAYVFPDEDEPSKGRLLVVRCNAGGGASDGGSRGRAVKVAEVQLNGAAYSVCLFYDGTILVTVNSKTRVYKFVDECTSGTADNDVDEASLEVVGQGHHGHILSLAVKSRAGSEPNPKERLAIVGDLMRSIAVLKHHPEFDTLEEVARDFNPRWTTAVEMLGDDVYLGAENFGNLYVLRRNATSNAEELRVRLDTSGMFRLGEMVNTFVGGTLVVPTSPDETYGGGVEGGGEDGGPSSGGRRRRITPVVTVGSRTLFGTVDGTLGSVLGMDQRTLTFFTALVRAMAQVVRPVGGLSHDRLRAYRNDMGSQPHRGFVDGDMVESFLDLDDGIRAEVVALMNRERRWWVGKELVTSEMFDGDGAGHGHDDGSIPTLVVNDVLSMVEDISMMH